jgi:exodeoxyribonuclease V gamma subunit
MSGHGLTIYASNRLEALAEQLAATMEADPLGPLEREVVVLQSRGMYRWLTLELAKRLGVAATIATPFPGTFCRALAERIEGERTPGARVAGPAERYEPSERSPFERDVLAWRIFRLLSKGGANVVGPAAAYIKDDPDQRKRFQLATRLAARFDDYQLYRPDWLAAWERREQPIAKAAHRDTAEWQAALWRAVVAEAGDALHLGRRFEQVIAHLREASVRSEALPQRVSVFGAPSLPPIFLDLLAALSRHASVSLYVVSPTSEYWADIRSPREAAFALAAAGADDGAPAHFMIGHSLLASWGRQGRELGLLLHERDETGASWHPLEYDVPARTHVLATLQADIAELLERGHGSDDAPPLPAPRNDRSLEVHICHSPAREMQVIRDAILDAFVQDPSLRPHDVFVLAPNIGEYAPFIEAVFGVAHEGEPHLPFTIADRSARAEQPIVDAAFRLLELVRSRATASEVMGLFDLEPLRRAARLEEEDLATVHAWLGSTNIRWGRDGGHRESLGLPCDDVDTWRSGLDRLLLGYAMGDVDAVVHGIVPRGAAAGDADILGRFAGFVGRLFAHADALGAPRPLDRWAVDIRAALDELVQSKDDAEEAALATVRETLTRLAEVPARTATSEDVHLEVVLAKLREDLSAAGGAGFVSGAITFCSLTPMRAIPAKIIVVAGLQYDAFPRRERPTSFDLTAAARRPGDRAPRDDDRYAFLETVLAARERLILTYVGRSQKDNTQLAPSSVLGELLAAVDRTFVASPSPLSKSLTRLHPLQPFSERYFDASAATSSPLFSYSRANCRAAAAARSADGTAAGDAAPIRAFSERPLDVHDSSSDVVLADLVEFWVHPSKYFCTRTLGLRWPTKAGRNNESEPFEVSGLARYQLAQTLTARRIAGLPGGTVEHAILQATQELPHAGPGRAHYETLRHDAEEFVAELRNLVGGDVAFLEPLAIDVASDDWRLVGRLERVTTTGLLFFRPAKLNAKDRVRAWIQHLALCASADAEERRNGRTLTVPCATTVVGHDSVIRFERITEPGHVLDVLIRRYRQAQEGPLPLFEKASFAFAEQERKVAAGDKVAADNGGPSAATAKGRKSAKAKAPSKPKKPAIDVARDAFGDLREAPSADENFARGRDDCADEHVRLVWRDRDPLREHADLFATLARELWTPLLEACIDVTSGTEEA